MLDLVADKNAKGLDQWSALHMASNEGHLEVVKQLLALYVDVNVVSSL
jgi:ankyrin repeat protein